MEKDLHFIRRINRLINGSIIVWIFTALTFSTSLAETRNFVPDLDQVLAKIIEKEKTLRTFTADFKQIQQSRLFHQPQISEGMIFFDHSGNILMNIIQPHAFILLIKDDIIITGDPVTARYRKKNIAGRHSFFKRIAEFGQSIAVLKGQYDIHLDSDASMQEVKLRLIPLSNDHEMPFDMIHVKIDPKLWLPEVIRLEESNGDNTIIELRFITINEPLPQDIFSLQVPPQNDHEK